MSGVTPASRIKPPARLGMRIIALHLLLIAQFLFPPPMTEAMPRTREDLADITQGLISTGVERGAIPTLYRPRYDRIQDANLNFKEEDVVFVVELPDGPRIYPQRFLVWHQVVNEVVDDMAIAITYCPITGSLMAYDASLNGLNLIFDVQGHLYDGNSVLIDRNSGSLWLQETGMAFDGPLAGRGLPLLRVFWTTWGAAKRTFPQAPVLSKPSGNRPYGRDPYGSYEKTNSYYQNNALIYPVHHQNKRFPRKTPMLCLEHEGQLMAIDIGYVKKKGAVNFFLGPHALLAVYDKGLGVVRVFNRHIWSEPFLFVPHKDKLLDLSSRSLWDPATGRAVEGNMVGASMPQYYGSYSMWFAWYSMNPETFTIPGPGEVSDALLSPAPPGAD